MSASVVDRYVVPGELKPLFGIGFSRVHLHRLEKAGKFPLRVRLSERRIAWRESELIAWAEDRSAQRVQAPSASPAAETQAAVMHALAGTAGRKRG
jgi:prophage regulatory protein